MSAFDMQELQAIAHDPRLTHHEQEQAVLLMIRREHANVLALLLSLQSLPNKLFFDILDILRKYLDVFDQIIMKPELVQLLDALKGRSDLGSIKIMLDMLKWDLKKNLSAAAIDFQSNIDHIASFAMVFLGSIDLEVAEKGSDVLRLLLPADPARHLPAFQRASLPYKQSQAPADRAILLRFYSLLTELLRENEDIVAAAREMSLIRDILSLCQIDDILVQMNAIELLVPIAHTNAGLEALHEAGGVRWVVEVLCPPVPDLSTSVLRDQALRCLGAIFASAASHSLLFVEKVGPGSLERFLGGVLTLIEGAEEEGVKIGGLAVLADFASISVHSLELALTFQGGRLVQAWLRLLLSPKPELGGAALGGLARVLAQSDDSYVDNERTPHLYEAVQLSKSPPEMQCEPPSPEALRGRVRQLKQGLVAQILDFKPNFLTYLLKAARSPIMSAHYAAQEMCWALTSQPGGWGWGVVFGGAWGVQSETSLLQSDFWVYLTDRLTESTKEGKERKYALCKGVADHPSSSLLPAELQRILRVIVQQGPYYMPPALEEMQTL